MHRMPSLTAAWLGAAWILAASVAAASGAGLATIVQRNRAFEVPSIQVTRGDTVRFLNDDAFLHQVYVDAPSFNFESPEQDPGQAVEVRFTQAGDFTVLCHIHPKMRLNVGVR